MSPTARTLKLLRDKGYQAGVVERYNSFTKQRNDLFGCIDLIAVKPGHGIVGVQACAGASHAARVKKSAEQPGLRAWLDSGGGFVVVSWAKQGGRGKRKVWTDRWEWLTVKELAAPAAGGR